MSLLIDALKQAEAARAQTKGEQDDTPGGLELEPVTASRNTPAQAATTNTHNEASSVSSRETRRSRPAVQSSSIVASDAARELFEVKRPPPNRLPLILAVVGVLLLLSGAGYVWWAIQPHGTLTGSGLNLNATGQIPTTAAPPPALAMAAGVSTVSSSASSESHISPQTASAVSAPPDSTPRHVRHQARSAQSTSRHDAETVLADDTRPHISSGGNSTAEYANGIQAAYAAFLEGNYPVARQRYQEVLRQDSRNIDAMNALGLIAWRSGQTDQAERMFRAALHADPKDATATAQLALLYSEGDPSAAESHLRNLIASQPAAAAPYYALGSLFSRQERWNEAQQVLFQAYTLDSDNPDVLFNLAICLEHLAQPALALQFYERAQQAALHRPASFDKNVAQSRIQALGSR